MTKCKHCGADIIRENLDLPYLARTAAAPYLCPVRLLAGSDSWAHEPVTEFKGGEATRVGEPNVCGATRHGAALYVCARRPGHPDSHLDPTYPAKWSDA